MQYYHNAQLVLAIHLVALRKYNGTVIKSKCCETPSLNNKIHVKNGLLLLQPHNTNALKSRFYRDEILKVHFP